MPRRWKAHFEVAATAVQYEAVDIPPQRTGGRFPQPIFSYGSVCQSTSYTTVAVGRFPTGRTAGVPRPSPGMKREGGLLHFSCVKLTIRYILAARRGGLEVNSCKYSIL